MTKLCCFNKDYTNPGSSQRFERHASELYRVHWNSLDLNPLDYHVWAPC